MATAFSIHSQSKRMRGSAHAAGHRDCWQSLSVPSGVHRHAVRAGTAERSTAAAVQVGDTVEATTRAGEVKRFKVTEVTNEELLGADVRVAYSEVASLQVVRKDEGKTRTAWWILGGAALAALLIGQMAAAGRATDRAQKLQFMAGDDPAVSEMQELRPTCENCNRKGFAELFASDWIAAWNSHDLDRILAHYEDDFEMTSPLIVALVGEQNTK